MIGLNTLSPMKGSTHRKKRVGTGRGSGHGEHSTRGLNGQSSRSGNGPKESKEGGQMPLFRRIPKSGFSNRKFAISCEWVNLSVIAGKFEKGAVVTPETMKEKGLVCCACRVKVLGGGELSHPLEISAHGFSKSAREKIEKAGGSAIVITEKN
ncbi:MAG: 50S ribosomal protein L15 [Elusimicrobiaceae bacterium]|nr:50S ribosomal protein L15 [Elusimicrobiaceae bacterium]